MAFAVESSTPSGALTSSSGATIAHTVTAANKLLVSVCAGLSGAGGDVNTITYAGAALSRVGFMNETVGNNYERVEIWQLNKPAAGSNSLIVTMFDVCDQLAFAVTGFTDAATALGTASTNQGTTANPSLTVVDAAAGDIVVSVHASDFGGTALTENGTLIFEYENIGADSNFGAQRQVAVGSNTVCSWTEATVGGGWALIGVAVKPAAPAKTATPYGGDGILANRIVTLALVENDPVAMNDVFGTMSKSVPGGTYETTPELTGAETTYEFVCSRINWPKAGCTMHVQASWDNGVTYDSLEPVFIPAWSPDGKTGMTDAVVGYNWANKPTHVRGKIVSSTPFSATQEIRKS